MNRHIVAICLFAAILTSCGVKEKVDKAQEEAFKIMGDQSFKTALSLIELYNIRYGEYPPSLDSITFTSAFDESAIHSVNYERLDTGYRLDMADGFMGKQKSTITYPAEFWQGTGVKQSNLLK